MTDFKVGDLVNSNDNKIQNAEIISIYTINNAATILWNNRFLNVYLKNLFLIKHQPFNVLLKQLKYKISQIKNFIYNYNPLNYRIVHKDKIDYNY